MVNEISFKKLVSHAKEYGYIFQSSEIYDGLSAVYDYGQYGVELKNNIKQYWWDSMVLLHENIVGLDSAIFMHPKTWEASGHVSKFNDPLIDSKDSKKRYRADELIEDWLRKIEGKIDKEIKKAAKKFGEDFDEEKFRKTNPRVQKNQEKWETIHSRFIKAMKEDDLPAIRQIIIDCDIADPVSGSKNWTEVRKFNLMFETKLGSVSEDASSIFMRPETAQGIFVNYLNVQKSGRMRIPFGIAQVGKAFRNEIVARQFLFRMREFEQMEMQYFVKPGEQFKWFDYWKKKRMKWYLALGIDRDMFRFHEHEKLAHYAKAAFDIEFHFPIGFKEVEGIHSRTNYDLSKHQEFSGKKLQYFDPQSKESYTPYVVETSAGLDRMFLAILTHAYTEEKVPDANGKLEDRVVLKIPAPLAPVKATVLPLVRKDGLDKKARVILDDLKFEFNCQYDEKDSIGRRYRRQDAIGTPFCITIDHQTMKDDTVTIRYRDSMDQDRVNVSRLKEIIGERVELKNLLKEIGD